jgi:hypothetical protein
MVVPKTIDTVWVSDPLYKLAFLNFPLYPAEITSPYHDCRNFRTSLRSATLTSLVTGDRVAQVPLLSTCAVECVWTTSAHTRQADLKHYSQNAAVWIMSHIRSLLAVYLEANLGTFGLLLRDWRVAINVSTSSTEPFVKVAKGFQNPDQSCFYGSQYSGRNSSLSWSNA